MNECGSMVSRRLSFPFPFLNASSLNQGIFTALSVTACQGYADFHICAPIKFPQPKARRHIFNAAWTRLAMMCHGLKHVLSAKIATTHPRWQRQYSLLQFYPIARRFHESACYLLSRLLSANHHPNNVQ